MKKFFLTLVAMMAMNAAVAQDNLKYLTVTTTSEESSIELAKIQKITFDTANKLVVVTTSEGEVKFPQTEMQKMFFSDAATAIESLPAKSSNLKMKAGVLTAKGSGLLRIYNASGALQRMANVEGSARINLSNLPAGVYIINMGEQTIKVRK